MSRVLAFDIGKSGCRVALYVDGARVAGTTRSSPAVLADPEGPAALARTVAAAYDELGEDEVDVVAGGVAGLHRHRASASALAEALGAHVGVGVVIASDMTTSHVGALAGAPGVVVAAGTGAVALAVDPSGDTRIADGWGWMLGDAGSGHAIGRAGLDAALRHHDGRGGSAHLAELAERRLGALDDLPQTIRDADNPVATIASFARDVLTAAEAGDDVADRIWDDAGRELARTAAAVVPRGDDEVAVSPIGGLFDAGPRLVDPFTAELSRLRPTARLQPPAGDAIDGAHRLALAADLPHEPHVHRHSPRGGHR